MLDESKLRSLIGAILEIDESSITQDTSMDSVESWDSIKHMDLILAIEEEFRVSVPDEEAADLTSYPLIKLVIGDLIKDKK
jgi:acyl carrier protein